MDDIQITRYLIQNVNRDVHKLIDDLKASTNYKDRVGHISHDVQVFAFNRINHDLQSLMSDRGALIDYDHGETNELINTIADDLSLKAKYHDSTPTIYEVYLDLNRYLLNSLSAPVISKLKADLESYNHDVKYWLKDGSYVK